MNQLGIIVSKEDKEYIEECIQSGEVLKEDLRRWFKEKWVDVSRKVDGKHPPCGRKKATGKGYPKCRPKKKVSKETPKTAGSYSKKEKKAMTSQKRRAEKKDPKPGKGNKPTFTRYVNEAFDVDPNEYKKILQTKDFLLVVPFTHKASCKYGANTKWCTTKRHDDEDFEDHVSSGVLAYLIVRNPEYRDKLNNSKFALFRYKGEEGDEDGLVYTELNNEYPIKWFKNLMGKNGLTDDYSEIIEKYNNFYKKYTNMALNENIVKKLTNLVMEELSNEITFEDLETLKKINKFVKKQEVIDWFNENDIEYFDMNDMEMYIMYIEKNMEDSEDLGSVEETDFIADDLLNEAEYQGRKVQLGKIMQGDIKKFKVYVKNDKGKVVKVNFGFGGKSAKGKRMVIKKNNPERRKSFRARHNCDNPGPRWKPRYWACRTW
jgi:hypothetical protein